MLPDEKNDKDFLFPQIHWSPDSMKNIDLRVESGSSPAWRWGPESVPPKLPMFQAVVYARISFYLISP